MSKGNVSLTAQVVASIAHDLRSPLNAVIGFSRIMLKGIDGPLSELQAADLEAIHTNGAAMLEMVDDIIDLARAETGWHQPAKAEFYLQSLLDKVRALAGAMVRKNIIEFAYLSDDRLPPVYADQGQIQKTIERIVKATMHFAGSGSILLSMEASDDTVTVKVTGTAPEGLSSDTPHILQVFHSSGASPEHRVDATALKMLVSQQLTALNGGQFWIEGPSETQITLAMSLPVAPCRDGIPGTEDIR